MPGRSQPQVQDEGFTVRLTVDFPGFGLQVGDHITADARGVYLVRDLAPDRVPPGLWGAFCHVTRFPEPAPALPRRPSSGGGGALRPLLRVIP